MILRPRSQTADAGSDALRSVAAEGLARCGRTVAGGRSILKVHRRARPVGINCSVERGPVAGHVAGRPGRGRGRS